MLKPTNGFQWRSQSVFVLIAAGATLSLNDFLTFPILVGQNGGGAFLLLYMFFLLLMGLPLLMGELLIGRLGRLDPAGCFEILAKRNHASVTWKSIGFISMVAAFLIVATFSVVAGWSLSYLLKFGLGFFNHITVDEVSIRFDEFIADIESMTLWHTLFVILLVSISAQNLRVGVERISLLLVPGMVFLLLVGLTGAIYSPGFDQSAKFLLYTDFSALDSNAPLVALHRAFYTLALGTGAMIAYGSYLPRNCSIGYAAMLVIVIDLTFSILVGLSINALIFSADILPDIDNQFAFRVFPVVFNQLGSGQLYGTLFYLMLTLAALTTSIALMEGPVCYIQRYFQVSRIKAVSLLALGIWIFGLGVIFSYNVWNEEGFTLALFFGDEAVRLVKNAGFNDIVVFLSSRLIQPFAALMLCLFLAWVIPRQISYRRLGLGGRSWFEIWNYLVRYVTPVLLLVVTLGAIGVI